jgi:hypothetical protein
MDNQCIVLVSYTQSNNQTMHGENIKPVFFRMFSLLPVVAYNSNEKLWMCWPLYAMDISGVVQMKLKK